MAYKSKEFLNNYKISRNSAWQSYVMRKFWIRCNATICICIISEHTASYIILTRRRETSIEEFLFFFKHCKGVSDILACNFACREDQERQISSSFWAVLRGRDWWEYDWVWSFLRSRTWGVIKQRGEHATIQPHVRELIVVKGWIVNCTGERQPADIHTDYDCN